MTSEWNDLEVGLLINERKNRNVEYHGLRKGRQKHEFWDDIALKINEQYGKSFTGNQCHNKFHNLTRSYYVSNLSEF
jgi:hypothetical protein